MVGAYRSLYGVAWHKVFLVSIFHMRLMFIGAVMQDAHEFLNFLLNQLVDILEKESHKARSEGVANGPSNGQINGVKQEPPVTWVHKNFQVNILDIVWCPVIRI